MRGSYSRPPSPRLRQLCCVNDEIDEVLCDLGHVKTRGIRRMRMIDGDVPMSTGGITVNSPMLVKHRPRDVCRCRVRSSVEFYSATNVLECKRRAGGAAIVPRRCSRQPPQGWYRRSLPVE